MKTCPKCGNEISDERLDFCPVCQISFEGYELKEIKEKISKQSESIKKEESEWLKKYIFYITIFFLGLFLLLAPIFLFQIYSLQKVPKKTETGLNVPRQIQSPTISSETTASSNNQAKVNFENYIESADAIEEEVNTKISENATDLDVQLIERIVNLNLKLFSIIENNPGAEGGDSVLFKLYEINYKTYQNWRIGYEHGISALDLIEKYYNTPSNRTDLEIKRDELEELKGPEE